MAILPKGGLSIAGHKIPWEAIAAIAGVAGVLLVLRARQQGQNVASVGQAPASPYTAAASGFGASFAPDYSAALANLSSQLNQMQQTGLNTTSPTVAQLFGLVEGPGGQANQPIPLAGVAGGAPVGFVQPGQNVSLIGSPQQATWNGQAFLTQEVSLNGSNYWVNLMNLPPSL